MKWDTVDALLESAKKYADIEEDLAVKSCKDHIYWHHRVIVDLIRSMAGLIDEGRVTEGNYNGKRVDQEGYTSTWGSPQEVGGPNGAEDTSQETG